MASMREVAELFKEKGIPFTPKNFDAYIKGASLEELIPKEEKKGKFEPGLSNAKSQGRKVVDQLYNRGMGNIVSDEELKNA